MKMKQLRMQVRSSLYDKTTKASHVHEFGKDTYNEEDDTYTHTCTTCGYEETYEKMWMPEYNNICDSMNQFDLTLYKERYDFPLNTIL